MVRRRLISDESVADRIRAVMVELGIGSMPSQSQTVRVTGGYRLNSLIAKRGGFNAWADRLGIPRSENLVLFIVPADRVPLTSLTVRWSSAGRGFGRMAEWRDRWDLLS